MADVVTTQVLENGPRRIVYKFTNFSDGTGESAVKKVDATSAAMSNNDAAAGTNTMVTGIMYDIRGGALRIQWDATSPVDMLVLGGFSDWQFLGRRNGIQGLSVPSGTVGATGSILFTTVTFAGNSSYTVIMELVKGVPQS